MDCPDANLTRSLVPTATAAELNDPDAPGVYTSVDVVPAAGALTLQRETPGAEAQQTPSDFDAFYRAEFGSVAALSSVLTGSHAVGEEIAQDAFCSAFRRWERIRTYDNPAGWVRRVAANMATSAWRRRAREANVLSRLRRHREVTVDEPSAGDEEFWEAVRRLPPRQAHCLSLRYLEDLATAEIAAVLGIAEATVRVHLHAGRLELGRRLSETVEDDE
jgi:RNA polymerase sigma-70 factor (ECF subfamily)